MIINCFFLILTACSSDSEEIHFLAYQRMCEKYGFKLDWSFDRYCRAAHYRAEGLKEDIYHHLPVPFIKPETQLGCPICL